MCPRDPGELLALAVTSRAGRATPSQGAWASSWAAAEEAAQGAIEAVLAGNDELTEPFVARHVFQREGVATIVVASSMPVRDLEWFAKPVHRPPAVFSNRGANGIDGVASTTLGVAAARAGTTVGILGDLAFLHDLTAFVRPDVPEEWPKCVFVVVDNRGEGSSPSSRRPLSSKRSASNGCSAHRNARRWRAWHALSGRG